MDFVNTSTSVLKPATPAACEHIVTTYVVPNILHFVAFFMGVYHFRIQENEQLYALMEKVCNQSTDCTGGLIVSECRLAKWP